jgi:lipopolysaccharide export LptBFGC system permease protein LptF
VIFPISTTLLLSPLAKAMRRFLPAPLGWHTRSMIASYCRHTFLVTCGILAIALSIDLTFYLAKVLATAPEWRNVWAAVYLTWYLGLRSTDFLAELLPLACFFGVFWSEIAHTKSQERLVVWLSGRGARQCLVPVLLFGAIVGGAELALNIYIRPVAVMTQVATHLGSYGERFDRRPLSYPQWIASRRDLIQAFVEPGSPPTLRDVRVYRMDEALSLQTVFRAKLAKPLDDGSWMLIDGHRWTSQIGASQVGSNLDGRNSAEAEQERRFAQEKLDLNVAPIWINNFRISARYLTNDVFRKLTKVNFFPNSEFRTWNQARYSLSLFCAVMPLLAASLSMLLMAYEVRFAVVCFIAIAGYVTNTVMKLFVLLGEHGYLSPVAAGWSVPTVLLLISAVAVLMVGKIDSTSQRLSVHA